LAAALQEGAIFAERYRVVRCIASGGMGAVYEVIHLETERRRALKVMLPHVLQSEDMRERFKREAKVAAHVESEHIVDVFDAGIDDATQMPFLVMELLRGEELAKRIKRMGRLGADETLAYLHQVASALDETHRASIVHRDLKPENVFLVERRDGPPRVKVLDFGVAKLVAEGATAAGATQVVGTPTYMAPEQFRNDVRLTPAADIYALGMMAYTMLVGKPYWAAEARGGNVFALAAAAMLGPKEPASARAGLLGVHLPPGFDAWFAVATAADPLRRFPSASALVRALSEVLTVSAPAPAAIGMPIPMAAPPVPMAAQAAPVAAIAPSMAAAATHMAAPTAIATTPMAAQPPALAQLSGAVARAQMPPRVGSLPQISFAGADPSALASPPPGALTPPTGATPAVMSTSNAPRAATERGDSSSRVLVLAGLFGVAAIGIGTWVVVARSLHPSREGAAPPEVLAPPAAVDAGPAAPPATTAAAPAREEDAGAPPAGPDPLADAARSAKVAPTPPASSTTASAAKPPPEKTAPPKDRPKAPAADGSKRTNREWTQD
jgi:serine/threonine-protein kinase